MILTGGRGGRAGAGEEGRKEESPRRRRGVRVLWGERARKKEEGRTHAHTHTQPPIVCTDSGALFFVALFFFGARFGHIGQALCLPPAVVEDKEEEKGGNFHGGGRGGEAASDR